jgi:hypothetical protein
MAVMNAGDLIVRPTDNPTRAATPTSNSQAAIRSAGQTSNLQAAV